MRNNRPVSPPVYDNTADIQRGLTREEQILDIAQNIERLSNQLQDLIRHQNSDQRARLGSQIDTQHSHRQQGYSTIDNREGAGVHSSRHGQPQSSSESHFSAIDSRLSDHILIQATTTKASNTTVHPSSSTKSPASRRLSFPTRTKSKQKTNKHRQTASVTGNI